MESGGIAEMPSPQAGKQGKAEESQDISAKDAFDAVVETSDERTEEQIVAEAPLVQGQMLQEAEIRHDEFALLLEKQKELKDKPILDKCKADEAFDEEVESSGMVDEEYVAQEMPLIQGAQFQNIVQREEQENAVDYFVDDLNEDEEEYEEPQEEPLIEAKIMAEIAYEQELDGNAAGEEEGHENPISAEEMPSEHSAENEDEEVPEWLLDYRLNSTQRLKDLRQQIEEGSKGSYPLSLQEIAEKYPHYYCEMFSNNEYREDYERRYDEAHCEVALGDDLKEFNNTDQAIDEDDPALYQTAVQPEETNGNSGVVADNAAVTASPNNRNVSGRKPKENSDFMSLELELAPYDVPPQDFGQHSVDKARKAEAIMSLIDTAIEEIERMEQAIKEMGGEFM